VTLFADHEIHDAQVGYSIGDSGKSFVGEQVGDWKENWLVIGYEDLCGDPIFIDLSQSELPVFTAAHGEGDWNPILIGSSLDGFVQALIEVERLAQGRNNPVQLERKPLTEIECEMVLSRIAKLNRNASLEFRQNWLGI
jgi:hypothetical protein